MKDESKKCRAMVSWLHFFNKFNLATALLKMHNNKRGKEPFFGFFFICSARVVVVGEATCISNNFRASLLTV